MSAPQPGTCRARRPAAAAAVLAWLCLAAAAAQAADDGLKLGEYACYGSGSRVLAGLGFKVLPGGRYTDLDGKERGTYRVDKGRVTFRGGHLAEIEGRDVDAKGGFRAGKMAVCEPW